MTGGVHLRHRESGRPVAFVVKHGGDPGQRAWYCYPAISGVRFTVDHVVEERQFDKPGRGRPHIYGADGSLVSERPRSRSEDETQYE